MARQRDEDRVVLGHLTATPMRERGEQDGRRYWRIRDRQTRATVQTGWWTRAEVDAQIAEAHQRPRTPRSAPAGGRTVADLLRAWRDAQVRHHEAGDLAPATLRIYRTSVRHWLSTPLAEVVTTRLTRAAVEDQGTTWRADGVAPRTVDLDVRILRAAVTWGADRDLCPVVDLAIPAQARDDEHVYCGRVPTRAEVAAVLEVVPPGARRDAIEILALTGARVGEVVALRVHDVTPAGLVLSGRDPERGKRGKVRPRVFPLSGRLRELVEGLATDRAADERLCPLPKTADHMVYNTLARASQRAEVLPVTPHGIRRLVVSELLDVADPRTVSELTGHSVVVLLRYYVRPSARQLADVVARAALGVESADNVRPMKRPKGGG